MIAWLRRMWFGPIRSELPEHPVLRVVSRDDGEGAGWWHEVHGGQIPWASKTHEVSDGIRNGEITRSQLAAGQTAPLEHAVVIAHSPRRALEEWRFWTRCADRDVEPRLVFVESFGAWLALPPNE